MSNVTGNNIEAIEHVKQSIIDIITTPIGTRLLRRDYGCSIYSLLDQPISATLIASMQSAVVHALSANEPRIEVRRVEVKGSDVPGSVSIDIDMIYLEEKRLVKVTDIDVSL